MTDCIFTKYPSLTPIIYWACFLAHYGAAAGHNNMQRGRGGNMSQFCLILFCGTNRWDTYAICFLCVCIFLTRLVSITRPPFQATITMSGGSGADDWTSAAGSTLAASAENPLDRNEYPDKGATAASAKVRYSLILLVFFCLSFFPNGITLIELVLFFHFYRYSKPMSFVRFCFARIGEISVLICLKLVFAFCIPIFSYFYSLLFFHLYLYFFPDLRCNVQFQRRIPRGQ